MTQAQVTRILLRFVGDIVRARDAVSDDQSRNEFWDFVDVEIDRYAVALATEDSED